jgi:hypothetical protein
MAAISLLAVTKAGDWKNGLEKSALVRTKSGYEENMNSLQHTQFNRQSLSWT